MIIKNNPLIRCDLSSAVWRYMDFTSFYAFVINQSLYFKRLDKYTDSFEGTLHDRTIEELLAYRKSFDLTTAQEAEDWTRKELINIENYKAWTLSNSWSLDEEENYALWKIYLNGSNEGVAIKTTIGSLNSCLDANLDFEIYLGKVSYEAIKGKDIDVFNVSTNKRQFYIYEKEVRALMFHQFLPSSDKSGQRVRVAKYEIGATVAVDIKQLIGAVYISPFAQSWFTDLIKGVCNRYLTFLPEGNIRKSGIKDR